MNLFLEQSYRPKTHIHYFSATGNSRLAAQVVGDGLKLAGCDVLLQDIRKFDLKTAAKCLSEADFLGFVFPIYAFRAAIPMETHIRSLPRASVRKPVFMVATFAGYLDRAFMRLRDFLLEKNYVPVLTTSMICQDAWTVVRIENFIYDNGWPKKEQLLALREFAKIEIPKAWRENRENPKDVVGWVPFNPLSMVAALFPTALHKGVQFPIMVKKALCVRCGICVRQCPVNRLRLDPFPKAKGDCVGCYGCINSCPHDAINTWFTNGRLRYRGPVAKLEDIKDPEDPVDAGDLENPANTRL